ncbi:MAG: class I SAM-dependent methyltransferase [Candidatus Beckwithbacteria bacterium]
MQLEERYKNNDRSRFQQAQTNQFLKLLTKQYDRVLEVGCGKGYWSYVGAKHARFKSCFGGDVYDDFQREEIRQKCQQVKYGQIKGKTLPFGTNQFDLVFSMDVIEHIEDDNFYIKENLRVCKKGGEIIIGTPNYWRITNILLLLLGRLKFPRNMGPDSYGDCIHLREYKRKELVNLVTRAGGKDIRIYPCWLGILALSLGIEKLPFWLKPLCHFWFIKFKKYD